MILFKSDMSKLVEGKIGDLASTNENEVREAIKEACKVSQRQERSKIISPGISTKELNAISLSVRSMKRIPVGSLLANHSLISRIDQIIATKIKAGSQPSYMSVAKAVLKSKEGRKYSPETVRMLVKQRLSTIRRSKFKPIGIGLVKASRQRYIGDKMTIHRVNSKIRTNGSSVGNSSKRN